MKVLFADQWKVIGVLNNKLYFQSKQYTDECCLISKAKFVNRATNETVYLSVAEGEIVAVPHDETVS